MIHPAVDLGIESTPVAVVGGGYWTWRPSVSSECTCPKPLAKPCPASRLTQVLMRWVSSWAAKPYIFFASSSVCFNLSSLDYLSSRGVTQGAFLCCPRLKLVPCEFCWRPVAGPCRKVLEAGRAVQLVLAPHDLRIASHVHARVGVRENLGPQGQHRQPGGHQDLHGIGDGCVSHLQF